MMFLKAQQFLLMILIISMSVPTTLSWIFGSRRRSCDSTPCQWSWGSCSETCGGGAQAPYITRHKGSCGRCDLPSTRRCNIQCCSVDCRWSYWSSWSSCSKTCEYGTKMRSRRIERYNSCGGLSCSGASTDSTPCNTKCCPINIQNGNSVCTNSRDVGSTCSHSCLNRYRLVGSVSSTCSRYRSTTRWSPSIPSCQGFCSKIKITNGKSLCTYNEDVNSVCTHSCSSGYRLLGSATSKCNDQIGSSPIWSTLIPQCQGFCPTVSLPNGRTTCSNGHNVTSVCNHSCATGYRLVGSSYTNCLERNGTSPQWSSSLTTCQAICPNISIANGSTRCTRNEQINSFCIHSCLHGFPVGYQYSRCLKRKASTPQWSPPVPRCPDKLACPKLSISHATTNCTQGEDINSICRHTCSPGYIRSGVNYARCAGGVYLNPRWIPPPLPCIDKNEVKAKHRIDI